MLELTKIWSTTYPDAHTGILVLHDVENPTFEPHLEKRKQALQDQLRARYAGEDRTAIETHPAILAYNAYYKPFKKTYHVQAQLKSIVFKGRAIPSVSALVEAMFMAEVKNLLLTAGHDLDLLHLPLTVRAAIGDEVYTTLRGEEKVLKTNDMFIADSAGVISSIIYGPDRRTQINPETRKVLFTVYAPAGIGDEYVFYPLARYRRQYNPYIAQGEDGEKTSLWRPVRGVENLRWKKMHLIFNGRETGIWRARVIEW